MRPKGVIALVAIVLLAFVGLYFFIDDLIEEQLESAGESIVGAKVEIDNLKFSLAGLSISWDRLQVTDPNDTWKNLFETGRLSFDMEVAPLARKKVVINDVSVTDIRLGTKRETDGRIPQEPGEQPGWLQQASENLQQHVANSPILNLGILKQKVNVDSLMATFDIQAVAKIEQARQEADLTFRKWQTAVADFDPKGDLQKVEGQINDLKSQELSGLKNLVSAADKSRKIVSTLKTLKQDIDSKKNAARQDLGNISGTFSQIDNWIKDDFNSIKSKANIGDFSAQNVGRMLFGDVVVAPTIQVLEYVALGRKYMPVAQKLMASGKVEKPARLQGQDIRFPLVNADPDFVMEHVLISAATSNEDTSQVISVRGEVSGITSQPRIYGQPLIFALDAILPDSKAYKVTGEFNHVTDVPEDRFNITATGVKLQNLKLPERPYLPSAVVTRTANIAANFALVGDQLDFQIAFEASPVSFSFKDGEVAQDNVISRITREVFGSVDKLTIAAGITGSTGNLGLRISSNIDDILAKRISAMIGGAVLEAKKEIRQRIDTQVGPKKQEALAFVAQNKTRITSEINSLQKRIDDQLSVIQAKKKEIEAEIDRKKKEGVKGVKGKLKGLFKKK